MNHTGQKYFNYMSFVHLFAFNPSAVVFLGRLDAARQHRFRSQLPHELYL